MNKQVSSDGAIVFWTAHKISRAVAEAAFDAEGYAHLIPKVDYVAAIDFAAKEIARTCDLYEKSSLRYGPLANQKEAVGVEVRRVIKGKLRNEYPFLFSIGVVDQGNETYTVEVLDVDANECPEVASNKAAVEQAATAVWQDACTYLPANDLTCAVVALIKHQHGVLMREGGGVYYLTKDKLDSYINISRALGVHGPSLAWAEFDPVVNPELVDHVCRSVTATLDGTAEELISGATLLQTKGAKPRSNGQRTRLQKLIDAESLAAHMKQALGVAFTKSCKMLQQAREAIGAEGIRMMKDAG